VIIVHHAIEDAVHGGRWQQDELRGEDFVVVRERQRGAVLDEALVPERIPGWSSIRFVLDAPLVAHAPGGTLDLRAGDVVLSREFGDAPARSLLDRYDSLTFVWRADSAVGAAPEGVGVVRPSPHAARALLRLAESMAVDDAAHASAAAFDTLDALRAAGLPLAHDARAAIATRIATRGEHEVARVVERALSRLSAQPMAVDLGRGLGVCPRQALRRVNDYLARYYRSLTTWRDYFRGMRMVLGTFFIGQPGATTEHVARLLGFGSPTSLCHAFHDYGLASPLAVQRALSVA
jgi:hypothetical protein